MAGYMLIASVSPQVDTGLENVTSMPELPEVETVRRGLEPILTDRKIERAIVRRPDLRKPFPANFAVRLDGQHITRVGRRAKYLLLHLGSDEILVIHLGMSGRILIHEPDGSPQRPASLYYDPKGHDRHDHVVFEIEGGWRVVFNDPRRFGLMDIVSEQEMDRHRLFADIGPEPLGNNFDATYLSTRLEGRKGPIKSQLLDQKTVAGLGNIYVCEALFQAGISPTRKAGTITGIRATRLVPEIRAVLQAAIDAGGSSLNDYVQTDGELGYFQHQFKVYDREGQPCENECGASIKRIVQSGRSTFFCPKCQI